MIPEVKSVPFLVPPEVVDRCNARMEGLLAGLTPEERERLRAAGERITHEIVHGVKG